MRLRNAWVLAMALGLLIGTLGCGVRPEPVVDPEPAINPEPITADAGQSSTEPEVGRAAAIAAIEKLRGSYACDEESPDRPIVAVGLHGPQVTDARLERLTHLKGLTTLRTLGLMNTRVTDAGLAHLKGLASLQSLNLTNTQVTDAGVNELKKALPDCRVSVLTRDSSGFF